MPFITSAVLQSLLASDAIMKVCVMVVALLCMVDLTAISRSMHICVSNAEPLL